MVAVCNFQSLPEAGARVADRCAKLLGALTAMSDDTRLDALCDSRALHAALFTGLAPPEFPDAAGVWRGTRGSSIETAPRAVFLARRRPGLRYRDPCLPADQVANAMAQFEAEMRRQWQACPGRTDPWRDAAFETLADLTARYFAIHPFMDGNGHLWRLSLPFLAARFGLETRANWTIQRRPYGADFSLAIQWHGDHPTLLADNLRRWFRPKAGL